MVRKLILTALIIIFMLATVIGYTINLQFQFKKGFEIYLSDTNELVFSDKDIIFYNRTSHQIKLSKEGLDRIKKMNLYHKLFVAKLYGKEIYKGAFWSEIDSISFSGIVMIDILAVQHGLTDNLRIEPCYPYIEFCDGKDLRNNSELFDYFQSIGKLVQ
ncbi:MAG: hypothetical protein QXE78_08265 [Nitrososphaeria archaeon]